MWREKRSWRDLERQGDETGGRMEGRKGWRCEGKQFLTDRRCGRGEDRGGDRMTALI